MLRTPPTLLECQRRALSTPAEASAKFWNELRSKARVQIDHSDLPPQIKAIAAEAIAGLWHQATEAARGDLRYVSYPVADGEPVAGWMLRVRGKGQKLREVPVSDPVVERLKAHVAARWGCIPIRMTSATVELTCSGGTRT